MITALRRRGLVIGVVLVIALAACGSNASVSGSASSGTAPRASVAPAGISASTRMICATEAKEEIGAALGVEPTKPLTPVWRDHLYSCDYQYATGVLHLSVKQVSNSAATKRYVDALATRLGKREVLRGLGQGAFTTRNYSVVVNKDDKVLLVDIHDLPAEFGKPLDTRANVGITVAATIMGCWTEV